MFNSTSHNHTDRKPFSLAIAMAATVISVIIGVFLPASDAYAFTSRTSAPAINSSWYYSNINPYYQAHLVGQCTWYAQGRASEILGTKYVQKGYNNGGDFWRNNSGYPTGQTPKVGALACAGNGGYGHVAVVEKVSSNGSFSVSEYYGSGDKSFHFNTYSNGVAWAKASTKGASKFQGFIYLVNETPNGDTQGKQYSGNTVVSNITSNTEFVIRSAGNRDYALDASGGVGFDGCNLQLYSANGTKAQAFSFERNSDGTYAISNWSGKAGVLVGLAKDTYADGGNVALRHYVRDWAVNSWYVEKTPDGYYSFRNKHSGKYLDVANGSFSNGANIQQYMGNGTTSQKFILEASQSNNLAEHTHQWGAWIVAKAPTCTEAGIKMRTCASNPDHKETTTIAASGHDLVKIVAITPTNSHNGNNAYCNSCFKDVNASKPTTADAETLPRLDGSSQEDGKGNAPQKDPWNIRAFDTLKVYTAKSLKKSAKSFKLNVGVYEGAKPIISIKYKDARKVLNLKSGKITVKKKTKKGTYKIQVGIVVPQTDKHAVSAKVITVTVKVK